jgi:hypothetical protein
MKQTQSILFKGALVATLSMISIPAFAQYNYGGGGTITILAKYIDATYSNTTDDQYSAGVTAEFKSTNGSSLSGSVAITAKIKVKYFTSTGVPVGDIYDSGVGSANASGNGTVMCSITANNYNGKVTSQNNAPTGAYKARRSYYMDYNASFFNGQVGPPKTGTESTTNFIDLIL